MEGQGLKIGLVGRRIELAVVAGWGWGWWWWWWCWGWCPLVGVA